MSSGPRPTPAVRFSADEQAFLDLPRRLYPFAVTSRATEAALLQHRHTLSAHFDFLPHIIRSGGEPIGRCALTLPGAGPAYVGFFESVDDSAVAGDLLAWAVDQARAAGRTILVGPVDASFWLRYRMKLDHFSRPPYVSEPYNRGCYPQLWREAGFEISHRYSSTVYPLAPSGFSDAQLSARLAAVEKRGFRLTPIDLRDWDTVMVEIHRLVMALYCDMPIFSELTLDEFVAVFGSLRRVIDPRLVTLAWREDELVGFSIALPDYGDLPNRALAPWTMARLLTRKYRYRQAVALYMGTTEPGLGSAMAAILLNQMCVRRFGVIGSLIAENKPTGNYARGLISDRSHYALWHKAVTAATSASR